MSKTKKPKIQAKFFPFAVRQPLWEMAKKYGKQKYTIVAIWDYMWWRSGKGGLFELADNIVCWDLDCDPHTLCAVRKILQAEGWLKKETLRDKGGKWLTRGWTVIPVTTCAKSTSGEEAQPQGKEPQGHEPHVAETTGEGTTCGGTTHTVVVHELDADASTSSSTPSASTPTAAFSFSPSVSLGTDVPIVAEPKEESKTEKPSLTSEEQPQKQNQDQDPELEALAEEVLNTFGLPTVLGLPYFTDNHVPFARRIAAILRVRNRSALWLAALVQWAKLATKDREAIFWKKRLQTGDTAFANLAEFLEKGTIAEQFDVYLRGNQRVLDVYHDEENDLLYRDGKWIAEQRAKDGNCEGCGRIPGECECVEDDYAKPLYAGGNHIGYETKPKAHPEPGSMEAVMANNQAKAAKASVASDIKAILAGFDPEEA